MTSKPAPKSKKKDEAKKPGPRLVVADIKPGIGHNSGEINPEAVKHVEAILHIHEQKKALAKAERDHRNALKVEFGILSSSVAREIALRKLDPDVRVQVETNHEDFKKMLGYQPQLDFAGGVPTAASAKAQPSEAELAKNGEGFTVEEDEAQDGAEDEGTESGKSEPQGGVITREG